MNKLLTIIIVNWNSGYHLRKCIESLLNKEINSLEKIVVVDNNSIDNSIGFLKNVSDKRIKVIKNKTNLGFAKGCNLGAKLSSNSNNYLLFLNPDTIMQGDSIDKSIQFMEKKINSEIGILGISLTNNGKVSASCFRFPSIKLLITEIFGISKIFPKLSRQMFDWDHNSSKKVDQVMGAFFLVRKELFRKLDGFDERFFVYYEEVDFALRAKKLNYKSFYNNKLKCFHYGGGCTENDKDQSLFLSLESRLLFFKKHFNKNHYQLAKLITLFVEPITRILYLLSKFDLKGIFVLLSAYKKLIKKIT